MSNTIQINKLPTLTWNRLKVNSAEVEWDGSKAVFLDEDKFSVKREEAPLPIRLNISDEGAEYGEKQLTVNAEEGSFVTIFETCTAEKPLLVKMKLNAAEMSSIRLVQLLNPSLGAMLRHETEIDCAENSKIEIITVMLGGGDIYSDNLIELKGDKSELKTEIAYLGRNNQKIDYNIVANHYGRSTKCDITAAGALMDSARKVFRGSIDFKNGSDGSVGSENETVLMLGDNVVNKTIPLILCAEENVEGTHGATIGELDDDTLFYFESRGIGKDEAENIMARAAIDRLIRLAADEGFEKTAEDALNAELNTKEGGE